MGSVIKNRPPFSRRAKTNLAIFLLYFAFAAGFVYFGLQPSLKAQAEVYALEAATATETLLIPSINLEAPVAGMSLNGADLTVPERIAGFYSAHENKTLVVGHSSTIFENLKNLEKGQTFTYADKTYIVTDITEQLKSDISMSEILKAEGIDTVVLMTCSGDLIPNTNGDHTHRLIITAEIAGAL